MTESTQIITKDDDYSTHSDSDNESDVSIKDAESLKDQITKLVVELRGLKIFKEETEYMLKLQTNIYDSYVEKRERVCHGIDIYMYYDTQCFNLFTSIDCSKRQIKDIKKSIAKNKFEIKHAKFLLKHQLNCDKLKEQITINNIVNSEAL